MILETNTTCDIITVTSENGYIDDIVAATGNECCHVLELGNNCCRPNLLLPIRSLYNFNIGVLGCFSPNNDLDPPGTDVSLGVQGINFNCIQTLIHPGINNEGTITTNNPISSIFTFTYNEIPVSGVFDLQVTVITCDGLEYVIDFTYDPTDIFEPCGVITSVNTTYPELPTGVNIVPSVGPSPSANVIELDPSVFGMTDVFTDGIYYVGISQTDINSMVAAEDNSTFVNCQTTCRVIDYLSNNLCSNIYLLFDALRYSDNCDTITYEQKCDMWYVIGKELGYFTNSPCAETTNCGCNK
jgi:hypothetical protein